MLVCNYITLQFATRVVLDALLGGMVCALLSAIFSYIFIENAKFTCFLLVRHYGFANFDFFLSRGHPLNQNL